MSILLSIASHLCLGFWMLKIPPLGHLDENNLSFKLAPNILTLGVFIFDIPLPSQRLFDLSILARYFICHVLMLYILLLFATPPSNRNK